MSKEHFEFNAKITKKTVFSSLVWKLIERFFSQFVNLVIQIILARILMPDDFGSLAIILAVVNFLAIFVQSGLATAIVQKEDIDEQDISTLCIMSIGIATLLYIGMFLLAPVIANAYELPALEWPMRVLALTLFPSAINSIQTAILSRRMEFKKLCLRSMIAVPASGAIGIAMAYMGFGLWALVVQNLSNMLIVMVIMAIGLRIPLSKGFSLKRAKEIYSFSGKILLSSIVSSGYDMVRTMTIGSRYTTADLAYYDKAYTYSYYVAQIVNSSITSVMLPVFSRKQSEPEELHAMARRSCRMVAFIMVPVFLGGAAVAEQLIPLLLTSKWAACIPFFVAFCILRIPGSIVAIDKQVYFAMGRSGITLFLEIIWFLANFTVLLVVMNYGVMYIAMGAVIVEWLCTFLIFSISGKVYGYSWRERIADLIRPLCNGLIMSLLISLVKFLEIENWAVLTIQIICGILVYIGLAVVTKDDSLRYVVQILKEQILKKKAK